MKPRVPRFRVFMAVSADGFIATSDGGVKWLEGFDGDDYGYAKFYKQISTLVMGKTTYDQVRTFGDWPYPSKQSVIVTGCEVADPPVNTSVWRGPLPALADKLRVERKGDVWLMGGAKLIAGFRRLGLIDEYDLFTMPIFLGTGVPMWRPTQRAESLKLASSPKYSSGVVRTVYRPS
jgi:dihydrofolate reductase